MKENLSLLVTWSDDESEEYKGDKEHDNQPIALEIMTSILESDTKPQEFSKDVTTNVRKKGVVDHIPHNPPAYPLFEEEEDEISAEELAHSYTVLSES